VSTTRPSIIAIIVIITCRLSAILNFILGLDLSLMHVSFSDDFILKYYSLTV
jgi:hypothetical protein